jgi:hypothetical protein
MGSCSPTCDRVPPSTLRVAGFGFRVSGFGFRVSGVSGFGFRVSGWGLGVGIRGRALGSLRAKVPIGEGSKVWACGFVL